MNENTNPTGGEPVVEPKLPAAESKAQCCPRCRSKLNFGFTYCPFCGLRVPPSPAPAPAGTKSSPLSESSGFSASRREILAALASYVLAWWYLFQAYLLTGGPDPGDRFWVLLFVLGFVGLTELLHWERKRPWESWIWLGCMGIITAGILLGRDGVWNQGLHCLFLHLAAVYWVLCRSGRLLEGESGHLLPFDGLDGFVIFPFYHFYLRIRTLWFSVKGLVRGRVRVKTSTVLWSLLALALSLGLFAVAVNLLSDADAGFQRLLGRAADWFSFEWDGEWLFRFFFSLPVGQYLFGLIAGTGREEPEKLRERGARISAWLETLRRVPNLVWTLLTGAFCLLYLVFFAVQSRYLFGAFTRTLPEGFIVSEYARQGFFELCKVMAVNFALLWLVTRASRTPVRENRPALVLCLVLLAESLLFAVVAYSKLMLYIDCFGFTPLRLQSSWLVCVLFAGCLAAGRTLVTGKKSLRIWLVFSAVSLSALCLV